MEKKEHTAQEAFSRINKMASMREFASKELVDRLSRAGFEEPAIEEALERARLCGIVDDHRFAEAYMRTKLRAGKGRQGIENELARLDIDTASIAGWEDSFAAEEDEEVARAVRLLEQKPPTSKNKREAAYRRLIGKGYSSSVASSASRIWYESLD